MNRKTFFKTGLLGAVGSLFVGFSSKGENIKSKNINCETSIMRNITVDFDNRTIRPRMEDWVIENNTIIGVELVKLGN